MSKVLLTKLSFKPVEKKKPIHKSKLYKVSKKLYCVCIEESFGNFVAHLNMKNDKDFPDILSIPFTDKSYNLEGKTKIFTISRNKKGQPTCILRDKNIAKFFPGLNTQYTPFRHKYVYSGYIVNVNGKHQFDVEDIFDNVVFCQDLIDNA